MIPNIDPHKTVKTNRRSHRWVLPVGESYGVLGLISVKQAKNRNLD